MCRGGISTTAFRDRTRSLEGYYHPLRGCVISVIFSAHPQQRRAGFFCQNGGINEIPRLTTAPGEVHHSTADSLGLL